MRRKRRQSFGEGGHGRLGIQQPIILSRLNHRRNPPQIAQ
jgi:hypothetical protein